LAQRRWNIPLSSLASRENTIGGLPRHHSIIDRPPPLRAKA
jgi:hypothetical protein